MANLNIQSKTPSEALQDYFKEFYHLEMTSEAKKSIPIIDDCSYDLVFYKEANAHLQYHNPPNVIPIHNHAFTIHNLKPPYTISFEGSLSFFTIKLQAWMNGSFFNTIEESGIIDITRFEDQHQNFYNSIFTQPNSQAMFQFAETYTKRLTSDLEITTSVKLVQAMCKTIIKRRGLISVNELSERFEKSRQYLNKVFQQHVMYSLKKYITTVRILQLIKTYTTTSNYSLTELAYDFHYFDQAHFNRDFKQISGVTPTYFFSNLPEFLLRH